MPSTDMPAVSSTTLPPVIAREPTDPRNDPQMPTGALTTLEADIAMWSELEPSAAGLIAFVVPRELK